MANTHTCPPTSGAPATSAGPSSRRVKTLSWDPPSSHFPKRPQKATLLGARGDTQPGQFLQVSPTGQGGVTLLCTCPVAGARETPMLHHLFAGTVRPPPPTGMESALTLQ